MRINPSWAEVGVGAILGLLVAQLFGNALYEGVLFRAVLLNQLVLKLRDRRWGFPLALVGSRTIFALLHVPNRLLQGNSLVRDDTLVNVLADTGGSHRGGTRLGDVKNGIVSRIR